MGKVIGIDLGTTYSAMAVLEGGKAEIIPNAEGSRTTPSVVGFAKDGELVVGEVAKRQAAVNPESTLYSVKRLMGRTYDEVSSEVSRIPFRVEKGEKGKPAIQVKSTGKSFTPEEVSSLILQKLKRDAEAYLGDEVTQAVITVPAYFEDAQRQATKDAGRIAGLEVLRIVNEPTAASLAYGLDKKEGQTILVFDLGGGTFDVSTLEFGEGVFEVKSTAGNNHLGGDDFDERLMRYISEQFQKEHGVDLMADRQAVQRLKEAAENAKKELSSVQKTNVNLPFVTMGESGPLHLDMDITRSQFETAVEDLIDAVRGPTEQAIKDAGLGAGSIDEVILVGGSTRIPKVQQMVKDLTGKDPNKSVNPDEAVALGAAIQAGVITGDVTDLLLLDVTPLSLGIETMGDVFTKLIEKNMTIPAKKTKTFTTAADNQTSVEVKVYQGERQVASANKLLGNFHLDGIPPAPRGIPQVEVTFDIDANGIVNVTAQDKGTGKSQNITITGSTRLEDDEVQRMQEEAEKFAEEDEKRVEEANARNEADALVHTSERTLSEAGDKVDASMKGEVQAAIDATKAALEGGNVDEIKEKTQALQEAVQKVGAAMYQQAAGEAAGAEGAAAGPEDFPGGAGPTGDADTDADTETRTKKGEGPDSIDVEYDVDKENK